MHQRGPALVRITLLSLLFGAFALALVQPAVAGTPESPEVQDPAGDHTVTAGTPGATPPVITSADFSGIDIVKAYVTANNTTVKITLEMNGAILASAKYNATFRIVTGTNVTNSSVQRQGTAVTGPAGVTATASGKQLNFTFAPSALGIVEGTTLSNLTVSTSVTQTKRIAGTQDFPTTSDDQTGTDTAGPGTTPFTFNGPDPNDVDGDGLPDACETTYFGGLGSNATAGGDNDGDGLTNGEECAFNPPTDPTKADSDGDGTNDKDDPFPTDATRGGAGSSGSGSNSGSGSGSRSGSNTGGTSTRSATDDASEGDVKNLGDAVEKLKSDLDYLGVSAGGMVAVLILAILALAVRWSL